MKKIIALKDVGKMQFVVFVIMSVISMYFFSGFSLVSPICNLIFIPVFSFVIVLPILSVTVFAFVIPKFAMQCFSFLAAVFDKLFYLMQKIALFKFASVNNISITGFEFAILITLSFMFLVLPKFLGKNLSLCCLLPILFSSNYDKFGNASNFSNYKSSKNSVMVYMLDVGQGLAVIIKTKNHTVLYDTGPKIYGTNFEAGSKVIIPVLNYFKIKQLSKVIISHPDLDHSGGYKAIRENLTIGQTITSEPKYFPYQDIQACIAGQSFSLDNVEFNFLHPGIFLSPHKNDNSCVLKITYQGSSILLPGDISKNVEQALVSNYNHELKSDILVVPHHGSKSSSSNNFLQAVAPKIAVVSAGYLNRFSHPHANIINRYNNLGIKLLNTIDCGMIYFNLGQNAAQNSPICYRMVASKFWNY